MSGHTPGPWHWTQDGLRGADGQLIIRHDNINPTTPDAKLIDSAPDLADALEALIDGFDHVANCRECGEMSPESCAGGGGGPALETRAKAVAALRAAGRGR